MNFTVIEYEKHKETLGMALLSAGNGLRGDSLCRMSGYPLDSMFELDDSWFGAQPKTTETVARALKEYCGISVEFEQRGCAIVLVKLSIVDMDLYNKTMDAHKEPEYRATAKQKANTGSSTSTPRPGLGG